MRKIIEQSYNPIEVPAQFREQLLGELLESSDSLMGKMSNNFWKKPNLLASVAAVIIVAIIIYGIYLPGSIEI